MPRRDPETHASYHIDGNYWVKICKRGDKKCEEKVICKKKQPLDEKFKGTEYVLHTSFGPEDAASFNRPFKSQEFNESIDITEDLALFGKMSMSIDLVEQNTEQNYYEEHLEFFRIVRKLIFKNTHPWVRITLFEPKF